MSAVLATTTLAASGEGAKAGPIGLAVILLLCIACYFLFKSMSKHMRQVRENFPTDAPRGPGVARPVTPKADLVKADPSRAELVTADPGRPELDGAAPVRTTPEPPELPPADSPDTEAPGPAGATPNDAAR